MTVKLHIGEEEKAYIRQAIPILRGDSSKELQLLGNLFHFVLKDYETVSDVAKQAVALLGRNVPHALASNAAESRHKKVVAQLEEFIK